MDEQFRFDQSSARRTRTRGVDLAIDQYRETLKLPGASPAHILSHYIVPLLKPLDVPIEELDAHAGLVRLTDDLGWEILSIPAYNLRESGRSELYRTGVVGVELRVFAGESLVCRSGLVRADTQSMARQQAAACTLEAMGISPLLVNILRIARPPA